MGAGAPPKYDTVKEMKVLIDQYFMDCDNSDEPYTVTGLALALNLTRKGLIDYENKDNPEFGNTIKRAKQRVESYAEKTLYRGSQVTGVIFNLKNNFGWKDKTETELSGHLGLGQILEDIDGSSTGLPDDQE